jgi:hypothetical protein
VGSSAGLGVVDKRKIYCPYRDLNPDRVSCSYCRPIDYVI